MEESREDTKNFETTFFRRRREAIFSFVMTSIELEVIALAVDKQGE
jgi:hypothetical protein